MPERITAVPADDWKSGPPAVESVRMTADATTAPAIAGKNASTPSRRIADREWPLSRLGSGAPGKQVLPRRLDAEPPGPARVEHDQGFRRRQARQGGSVR